MALPKGLAPFANSVLTRQIVRDEVSRVIKANPEDLKALSGSAAKRDASEQERVYDVLHAVYNQGYTPKGERITLRDMTTSNEVKALVPQVLEMAIQAPLEPRPQLQNLFTIINVPIGQQVSFPSIGGFPDAQDMGEAEQYPTMGKIEMLGSLSALSKKVGLKVVFTDEAWSISSSSASMDILAYLLTALNNSLNRTRERKAAQFLMSSGVVSFDNITTSSRRTNGRGYDGARNGTLLADDLITVWAEMLEEGFNVDTLIMHPLAWQAFMRDEELRTWAFAHGVPAMSQIWQTPGGAAGPSAYPQNGVNPLQRVQNNFTELSTLYTDPTGSVPFSVRVLVTPYAFYHAATTNYPNTADIILLDSSKAGFMINEEGKKTGEWVDPEKDIRNFKVSERYTFATNLQGRGIRCIRGLAINNRAFDFINRFSYSPTFGAALDLNEMSTDTVWS